MVSVICSASLDRAVKEFRIKEPGKILDKVRELVLETFEKSQREVKDGMDISLCAVSGIEGESGKIRLKWSGANNPLIYLNEGELKSIKGDKQTVGKVDNPVPFTTHSITLNKGDMVYIFTDGYADQFGGPDGKKFKLKQLKEILFFHSGLSLLEQEKEIYHSFMDWKGLHEQVDDICLIGVRV
jgi:hypothetical protein